MMFKNLMFATIVAMGVSYGSSSSCDFDKMYDEAENYATIAEKSAFMDQYMEKCGDTSVDALTTPVESPASIEVASRTAGCLPTLDYNQLLFRGKLTLKGSVNGNIYVRGFYSLTSTGCTGTLTKIIFDVERVQLSNKFTKKCVEITDNTFLNCTGTCSYALERVDEDPEEVRPPLQQCPGRFDILQIAQVSSGVVGADLSKGIKPAAIRFLESFNLSTTEASSGFIKYRNNPNELIELGSELGQSLAASSAVINSIHPSSGTPKIHKALTEAFDRFVASGRSGVPKVLLVMSQDPAFNPVAYEEAIKKLFELEDYIPLVINFDTNPSSQTSLKKIAGCENDELCQNFVTVENGSEEYMVPAAEYLAQLVCQTVKTKKAWKQNLYPSLKLKIEDLKVADIQSVTGVPSFLEILKTQSAEGLGISPNSLIPFKIVPSVQNLSSRDPSGFLTSKLDAIQGNAREAAASNSIPEGSIVEFLVVDEIAQVRSAVENNNGKMLYPEKLDSFLADKLSVRGLSYRAGPEVVQVVREAKLGFSPKGGYLEKLERMGREAVDEEDVDDAKRRLQFIGLLKDRTLLTTILSNDQAQLSEAEAEAAARSLKQANCLIGAGLKGGDLNNLCSKLRDSAPVTAIRNYDVKAATDYIRGISVNKPQLEYMSAKSRAVSYLINLKNGELLTNKNANSRSAVETLIPEFAILQDLLF